MLNVYFWNKNEKMLQIDLSSDLKEEPELQVLLYIIWIGNARIMNMSEFQFEQIYLEIYNFVNMFEHAWNITSQNKPEF